MNKRLTIETLLLGLGVLLIAYSLFFALPAVVPSFKEVSCEKITGQVASFSYDTVIWDEPNPPTLLEYGARILSLMSENSSNVLNKAGPGKIGVLFDADNKTPGSLYGYLYYRVIEDNRGNPSFSEFTGKFSDTSVHITVTEIIDDAKKTREFELLTDWQGYFSADIDCDANASCYRIIADYFGGNRYYQQRLLENIFYSARASYATCEWEEDSPPDSDTGYYWVLFMFLGLSAVASIFFVARHRRNPIKVKISLPSPEEIVIPDEPGDMDKNDSETGTEQISIVFSEIEEGLPDIWGAHDAFTIEITSKEQFSHSCIFSVTWDDGHTFHVVSDENGRAIITHRLTDKKDHTIAVYYQNSYGNKLSGWRTIRIVDYREEMVRSFGEMLEKLDLADIKIGRDMTPREVERMLSERLGNVPKESIRKVIEGFEEANYSTHPVDRERYVRMFKAIGEIIGK